MNPDTVVVAASNKWSLNRRQKIMLIIGSGLLILTAITIGGILMDPALYAPNYEFRSQAPSWEHPFGTDYLGRDMFFRTVAGLSLSIRVGLLAATVSSVIALTLGTLSAVFGGKVDTFVNWLVDLCMGIPHMILLILISIALGGGAVGVITGVAVTHWPSLTRVIRAEVMQVRSAHYVQVARALGKSPWYVASSHIIPHVIPQYVVGLILLFPHAILHEAGITFLGYGLPLEVPAVGVILSESMKHLATGMWWLAFFPGLALLLVVMLFDLIGDYIKILIDPNTAHE
ncbi:ABC transporter permease [Desulfosporosinus youngiae]|uniref:ABC-type dipeptide/oligopeptide/nickel transport system, permease component n=1 Tax=Desulfosporosinus youngiae DSM 17734 TaxID=768710 RepID=H5XUB5_9FIRM|nr:ABC transporter permease [Desulfosporosinus youngiae]EHQ89351.1 ABC-type dipeptide/oligopeptide/nickel transport system, permease component [Desulfosporosinus youngiae DSM 17734]